MATTLAAVGQSYSIHALNTVSECCWIGVDQN
jgi:hypothetical protein